MQEAVGVGAERNGSSDGEAVDSRAEALRYHVEFSPFHVQLSQVAPVLVGQCSRTILDF